MHGFADLGASRSWKPRLFWLAVLGLSIGLAVTTVVDTLSNYAEQPTVSLISMKTPRRFPSVMFCPTYWIDEAKYRRSGHTEDQMRVVLKELGMLDIPATNLTTTELMEDFFKITAAYAEIDQWVKAVARFPVVSCFAPVYQFLCNMTVSYYNTATQMCFRVDFVAEIDPWLAYAMQINIGFPVQGANTVNRAPQIGGVGYVRIGKMDMLQEMLSDVIYLKPFQTQTIGIDVKTLIRVNKRQSPCMNDEDAYLKCVAQSVLDICLRRKLKPPYAPTLGMVFSQVFSSNASGCYDSENSHSVMADVRRIVPTHCPMPCETTTVTSTVVGISDVDVSTGRNQSSIVLFFRNPTTSEVVTEKFVYSWYTILSAVGGQLSLWTGASVLSIFQLAYLLLSPRDEVPPV